VSAIYVAGYRLGAGWCRSCGTVFGRCGGADGEKLQWWCAGGNGASFPCASQHPFQEIHSLVHVSHL